MLEPFVQLFFAEAIFKIYCFTVVNKTNRSSMLIIFSSAKQDARKVSYIFKKKNWFPFICEFPLQKTVRYPSGALKLWANC